MESEPHLAFDRDWFERHQSVLLWLLNHWATAAAFRWILRIRKCDVGYEGRIVQLFPHCYTIFRWNLPDGSTVLTTDVRTHPKYAKRIYRAFKALWWSMHCWDLFADRWIPRLSFGYGILTAYPDPNPETTTVDGNVETFGGSLTWAQLIASAGNTVNDSNAGDSAMDISATATTDRWNGLSRSIYLFDMRPIFSFVESSQITDAVLSLKGAAKSDSLGATPNLDIYTSNPASNTALVAGDFTTLGSVSQTGSPITYAAFNASGYNNFTFDATGRGNVLIAGGIAKFGARNANYDVAAVSPTWVSSQSSQLAVVMADTAGLAEDPKLVVTYAATGPFVQNHLRPNVFTPGLAR